MNPDDALIVRNERDSLIVSSVKPRCKNWVTYTLRTITDLNWLQEKNMWTKVINETLSYKIRLRTIIFISLIVLELSCFEG